MAGRRRDRQLTVRLTEAEANVFEAARRALHSRGVLRSLPSQADTLGVLAAAVCHAAGQGGYSDWRLYCRAAFVAWEREHSPGHLQRLVGPWVHPSGEP